MGRAATLLLLTLHTYVALVQSVNIGCGPAGDDCDSIFGYPGSVQAFLTAYPTSFTGAVFVNGLSVFGSVDKEWYTTLTDHLDSIGGTITYYSVSNLPFRYLNTTKGVTANTIVFSGNSLIGFNPDTPYVAADTFSIVSNSDLASVSGIHLSSTTTSFSVTNNPSLVNISATCDTNARTWSVFDVFTGNNALERVSGLKNVTGVLADDFVVSGLSALTEIDFTENLAIRGAVDVSNNPSLTSLSTITLEFPSGYPNDGYVEIVDNTALTTFGGVSFNGTNPGRVILANSPLVTGTYTFSALEVNTDSTATPKALVISNFGGDFSGSDTRIYANLEYFIVRNTGISQFHGFNVITPLAGSLLAFVLEGNGALTSTSVLGGLGPMSADFAGSSTAGFGASSLYGFAENTLSGVSIVNNDALTDINALSSLDAVYGKLEVSTNAALTDASALLNIRNVSDQANVGSYNSPTLPLTWEGSVIVDDNPLLSTVDFSNLRSVGGSFDVTNNPSLTTLTLPSLTTVTNNVNVTNNHCELSCAALTQLTSVTAVGGTADVQQCRVSVDACAGEPCLHGGVCIDLHECDSLGFSCNCSGAAATAGYPDGPTCNATQCGDGVVAGGEACDDGNNVDGDGCASNCVNETTSTSSTTSTTTTTTTALTTSSSVPVSENTTMASATTSSSEGGDVSAEARRDSDTNDNTNGLSERTTTAVVASASGVVVCVMVAAVGILVYRTIGGKTTNTNTVNEVVGGTDASEADTSGVGASVSATSSTFANTSSGRSTTTVTSGGGESGTGTANSESVSYL